MNTELTITPRWIGGNGTAHVTVKIGDDVIACDKIDTAKASVRSRFAADLVRDRPGIDAAAVEAELLKLAASRVEQSDDRAAEDRSVAEAIIALAKDAAELFHDAEPKGYAIIRVDDHRETWPIRSRTFGLWLRRRLHEEQELSASGEALRQAVEDIESLAIFDGEEQEVHVRVAAGDDGAIYLSRNAK